MNTQVKKIISCFEVLMATVVVCLDVLMPTLLILGQMGVSLLLRRQRLSNVGFIRSSQGLNMVIKVAGLSLLWTVSTLGFTLPILMRLTGQQQDLGMFLELKGNLSLMLGLLGLSWTVAALGEEMVYRGYLQERIHSLVGVGLVGQSSAIIFTSILFGLAHTEQGIIGNLVTFFDALYFSLVKKHFDNNLWAAVLAHGFNNTVGIVGFYFLGPIYSLW